MQLLANFITWFVGIVPMGEELYLVSFFFVGFVVCKCIRSGQTAKGGLADRLRRFSDLHNDFEHRDYDKVLQGWAALEDCTVEALSLVVVALVASGRPDDVGIFVAKTVENLPHLRSGLDQVVVAVAAPACDVPCQHILIALQDFYDRARGSLPEAALKQLLLALAKLNDERRVAGLLADLAAGSTPATPELLSKVVQGFLACKNAEAALGYFDALAEVSVGTELSETSLSNLTSSCVEARNSALAEHFCSCAAAQDFTLDDASIRQILSFAVQAGRLRLARSLSKRIRKQRPKDYRILMRACGRLGKLEELLEILKEAQLCDMADTATYNCALEVCNSCGGDLAAKMLMTEMQATGRVDVASYNIMLKQIRSENAPAQAVTNIVADMQTRGLQPNPDTFNLLLSGALAFGNFSGAWRAIELLESSGLGVEAYTLSTLFRGYRHERRVMDAETIERALSLIKMHSVCVDEALITAALEACLTLRDANCLKVALSTFRLCGWTGPKQANLHTYGVFIKAHGQTQNIDEVWRLWREVTLEMDANEQLSSQMLEALVANDCLEDALTVFKDMKAKRTSSLNSQSFAVAYAMIIRGFAQRKDSVQALQCYEEMKANGVRAPVAVMNTLLDACSRVGDMSAATNLHKDMLESQCEPDLMTYSILIKGLCISNDLDEALLFFALMQKKGIRPDATVFNSLLEGCARRQLPELCERVVRDMEAAGVVPSNHSACILIKLYGRCNNLDAAFRVIDELPLKYGFRPNSVVFTCLISACISNGHLDRALDLRARMLREGALPDEKVYSTLLRGTLRAGKVEQCGLLLNAALDQQDGSRHRSGRHLLDENLVNSVLILIQRRDLWETLGRNLFLRLQNQGVSVRCPTHPWPQICSCAPCGEEHTRPSLTVGHGHKFDGKNSCHDFEARSDIRAQQPNHSGESATKKQAFSALFAAKPL